MSKTHATADSPLTLELALACRVLRGEPASGPAAADVLARLGYERASALTGSLVTARTWKIVFGKLINVSSCS